MKRDISQKFRDLISLSKKFTLKEPVSYKVLRMGWQV